MDSLNLCPGLPNLFIDNVAKCSCFLILSLPNSEMARKSPFVVHKAVIGIGKEPKSIKKLRSGDLLIETTSALQSKSFLLAKTFLDFPLTVTPHTHKSLNSCRGVISEPDLLSSSETEILEGLSDQGITQIRRITIKKTHPFSPLKILILTFNSPKLPSNIKAGYLNCKVRPYIPNPLRCFKCQRSHTDDVKDIIRQYHPVYEALQETFLKSFHTTKIRRYGCVRKDTEGPSVSGGVCIFTSFDVPSSALPLHTSLQAVAVRIHSTSLITVCCHYLPPNAVIHQHDLNNLVDQLPAPFVILGDFNGHRTLWGDHFHIILSHDYDTGEKTFPPTYFYCRADWALFTQLAVITDAIVKTESVDTAVQEVTNVLITAAELSIPKSSSHLFQHYKPLWNTDCQTAYKNQRNL
ncbi:RNA-directed DNA polymerase from mobile element jockey [Trichonephila clavipes]|nr:RNA-directed DNA polymerase from mobile element jockey [Trichonephila clavipes]